MLSVVVVLSLDHETLSFRIRDLWL